MSLLRSWIRAVALVLALCNQASGQSSPADIEMFSRPDCPRCVAAKQFLDELRSQRPDVTVVIHDVAADPAALARLFDLARAAGIQSPGVPAFLVHGQLVVGFGGAATGEDLRRRLAAPQEGEPPAGEECAADGAPCGQGEGGDRIVLPLVGPVRIGALGLPAFTVLVGLADGFNPCAMWVLLLLLALLVNLRDRVRMIVIAGTFVVVSGVVYFAFMAAWLNVFLLVGVSRGARLALGALAVAIGAVHVKDFLAPGRGLSLSVPARAKPRLYERIRRILQAENLAGALAGVVVLALLANSVELLCTAGLPAVYTRVLTLRELPAWEYYSYLALYNLAYILDDSVMVLVAVVTFSRYKLGERAGRVLKLVSGAVMMLLGGALLFAPRWLAF